MLLNNDTNLSSAFNATAPYLAPLSLLLFSLQFNISFKQYKLQLYIFTVHILWDVAAENRLLIFATMLP